MSHKVLLLDAVCQGTLQMPNEVPLHIRRHLRGFLYQLLNVVFAKMPLAGGGLVPKEHPPKTSAPTSPKKPFYRIA